MDTNLMKAILAMDSYNRGYNFGIDLGSRDSDPKDTRIGNAIIYNFLLRLSPPQGRGIPGTQYLIPLRITPLSSFAI